MEHVGQFSWSWLSHSSRTQHLTGTFRDQPTLCSGHHQGSLLTPRSMPGKDLLGLWRQCLLGKLSLCPSPGDSCNTPSLTSSVLGWSQQQQHKAFIGPVQCSHAVLVPYSFSNKLLQTRWLKNNRYLLSNSSGRPSTFGGPKSRCWQGSSLLGVLRELPQRPLIASGVTRHPGVPWLAGASLQSLPLPSHVLLYLSVQMSLFLNGQQWLD